MKWEIVVALSASWRKTAISVVAACVGWIDNGIYEKHIAIIINQYITIYRIKDVV